MPDITTDADRFRLLNFSHRAYSRYGRGTFATAPCVVCVPARNEAEHLPAFLMHMARAFRSLSALRGRLVVALDGCTDESRDILDSARTGFPVPIELIELPAISKPHAGRVRRAAMDAGIRAYPSEDTILFTTDADTRVDRHWLSRTRALMDHTDFVCGDIWRDDLNGNTIRAPHEHHYHALHRLRRRIDPVAHDSPDPHPQGFGASLAMRSDVYFAIGRCPRVASDEDTTMVRAARRQGYRVRQDRSVKVLTSSRRDGRARGGLADALVREDAMAKRGEPILIVDPRRYVQFYGYSAELRQGFSHDRPDQAERTISALGLDRASVETAWTTARAADAFIASVLPEPEFTPDMPLEQARDLLEQEARRYGVARAG